MDLSQGWGQSPSCRGKAGALLTPHSQIFWDRDITTAVLLALGCPAACRHRQGWSDMAPSGSVPVGTHVCPSAPLLSHQQQSLTPTCFFVLKRDGFAFGDTPDQQPGSWGSWAGSCPSSIPSSSHLPWEQVLSLPGTWGEPGVPVLLLSHGPVLCERDLGPVWPLQCPSIPRHAAHLLLAVLCACCMPQGTLGTLLCFGGLQGHHCASGGPRRAEKGVGLRLSPCARPQLWGGWVWGCPQNAPAGLTVGDWM